MAGARAFAVVIPVGPGEDPADTLSSVLRYVSDRTTIVLVDDRADPLPIVPEAGSSAGSCVIDVIPAPNGAPGALGGLFVKVSAGIRRALAIAEFDLLLRLDTDALMIGAGLEELARRRFAELPGTGILGSYRHGPDGGVRDWGPAARALASECGLRGMRRPSARQLLRRVRREALRNGYVAGEHALGGAYLMTSALLRSFAERGWLDLPDLATSHLGEDHLAGLFARAVGYQLGDFGGPSDPLALRWKGLPAPPAELLASGKLVVHSVKSRCAELEATNRAVFADARRRVGT